MKKEKGSLLLMRKSRTRKLCSHYGLKTKVAQFQVLRISAPHSTLDEGASWSRNLREGAANSPVRRRRHGRLFGAALPPRLREGWEAGGGSSEFVPPQRSQEGDRGGSGNADKLSGEIRMEQLRLGIQVLICDLEPYLVRCQISYLKMRCSGSKFLIS